MDTEELPGEEERRLQCLGGTCRKVGKESKEAIEEGDRGDGQWTDEPAPPPATLRLLKESRVLDGDRRWHVHSELVLIPLGER